MLPLEIRVVPRGLAWHVVCAAWREERIDTLCTRERAVETRGSGIAVVSSASSSANSAPAGGPQAVAWPSQQFGLKLTDVGEGKWIEGDALRLAWSAVNANPLNPILQDGDTYYQAQVLVSGVTGNEPPN